MQNIWRADRKQHKKMQTKNGTKTIVIIMMAVTTEPRPRLVVCGWPVATASTSRTCKTRRNTPKRRVIQMANCYRL